MPGAHLTAAGKRRMARNNWSMVISQIETALVEVRGARRRAILIEMYFAAHDLNAAGVLDLARAFCRLTKKVPPGCYYQCGKEIKLPGEEVQLPRQNLNWTLALVHPQVYR